MIRALALAALLLPVTALPAVAREGLRWRDCSPGAGQQVDCTRLEVPLDRAMPDGPKVSLNLTRLPASELAARIGSLVTNPGGPGGWGAGVVAYGGLGLSTPEFAEVRQHFDVIGMDPRGVGLSAPRITVDPAKLYDPTVNRFPADQASYARSVVHNRAAEQDCLDRTGPLLSHVDTWSVVEDVEAIRGALDEPTISWLGVSYGTEAAYAAKYGHVRAMVLDGAVDHTEPMRKAILVEAAATEDGLRRFVTWGSTADQCVLRGQDVLARYDVLMRGGVPAKNLGRPATADELAAGIYGYLNEPAAWPDLAKALAAAGGSSPDASGLTDVMQFDKGDNGTGVYAAYRAVGRHDFPSPFTGPADMRVMGDLLRVVAPHSWRYSEYWDFASGCTGWPVKAQNPPGPEVITGTPPILLVGGLHDPATPWRWTHALASRIENGTLLTYTGDGHTRAVQLVLRACAGGEIPGQRGCPRSRGDLRARSGNKSPRPLVD